MGYRSGRRSVVLASILLFALPPDPSHADEELIDLTDPAWVDPWEDEPDDPYVSLESFPLPTVKGIDTELLMRLSDQIGVGGTSIAGIRLKVGLPRGYALQSIHVTAADAMFLVKDRPFLSRVGGFFIRVARFLLLGRVVSAGSSLEIPAEAWYVLFETTPLTSPSVTLHTREEVEMRKGDPGVTDHGSFHVCRFLLAANAYSELVNVRITVRNPRTSDVIRYHVPRLRLPILPRSTGGETISPTKLTASLALEQECATSSTVNP